MRKRGAGHGGPGGGGMPESYASCFQISPGCFCS